MMFAKEARTRPADSSPKTPKPFHTSSTTVTTSLSLLRQEMPFLPYLEKVGTHPS